MQIINDWWDRRKELRNVVGKEFKHTSPMQSTTIQKIVINSGVGQAVKDKKCLESTEKLLQRIAQGQKPILTCARKSIIAFKIRKDMLIGCKVTLRRQRAWNFLFELINIILPRIKNFEGLSTNSFDQQGNYNLGISDLSIFPAVPYDLTYRNQGCQITIVFNSSLKKENKYFLELFNFPFFKAKNQQELK